MSEKTELRDASVPKPTLDELVNTWTKALSLIEREDARESVKSYIESEIVKARAASVPVDMILHCPKCGLQHIDAPDDRTTEWVNPPHRSHLCHGCGHIWRPADVPTNGVAAITTKGKDDSHAAAVAMPCRDASTNPPPASGQETHTGPDGCQRVTQRADWMDCERISNIPAVHETIQAFADDPTADNATGMVQAVIDAGMRCTYCCAKKGDPHADGCPEVPGGSIEQWHSGQPVPVCPICHDTGIAFGKVCECGK